MRDDKEVGAIADSKCGAERVHRFSESSRFAPRRGPEVAP